MSLAVAKAADFKQDYAIRWKARLRIGLEFLHEQWHTFGAATAVAHGIFHFHLPCRAAVAEEYSHGVGDGAFVGFEILARVTRIFAHNHLRAERVNARV